MELEAWKWWRRAWPSCCGGCGVNGRREGRDAGRPLFGVRPQPSASGRPRPQPRCRARPRRYVGGFSQDAQKWSFGPRESQIRSGAQYKRSREGVKVVIKNEMPSLASSGEGLGSGSDGTSCEPMWRCGKRGAATRQACQRLQRGAYQYRCGERTLVTQLVLPLGTSEQCAKYGQGRPWDCLLRRTCRTSDRFGGASGAPQRYRPPYAVPLTPPHSRRRLR